MSRDGLFFLTVLKSKSVLSVYALFCFFYENTYSVLRIRDVYPGSRIQKPQLKEGVKKFCCQTFFCSHKFHKIVNHFIFEMMKEKICANFQRILELSTQKIVTKLSKIWVWDPGSEIRDPKKTHSGSRIQWSKWHRILDPDPQHFTY